MRQCPLLALLCVFAVLLTACAAPAGPVPASFADPTASPTGVPSDSTAYSTDVPTDPTTGSFADPAATTTTLPTTTATVPLFNPTPYPAPDWPAPMISRSTQPVKTAPEAGVFRASVTYYPTEEEVPDEILRILTAYFYFRANDFGRVMGMDVTDPPGLHISDTVASEAAARVEGLEKMRREWDCEYAGAQTQFTVDEVIEQDTLTIVNVHEAAYFYNWYEGYTTPEESDLSGYGIRHTIRIQNGMVISDHYNEGKPTDVAIAGRLDDAVYWAYQGEDVDAEDHSGEPAVAFPVNEPDYAASYDPAAAIAYADRWALARNTALYPDFHQVGGDCANFFSQCLLAGGYPQDDYWWYISKDDSAYPWRTASGMYHYLTGNTLRWDGNFSAWQEQPFGPGTAKGYAVIRCDDLTGRTAIWNGERVDARTLFIPGSPVFYRWKGGTSDDLLFSHVTLCVGTLGDGAPAISCHTEDRYHFKWTYGGTGADYGSAQLTPPPTEE